LFACGVRSARERSFEEANGETEVGRGLLAPEPRPLAPWTRSAGTQTKPQLEPATSAGVILPETGQFLLLFSLQLWQQLQRCRQTRARVPLHFDTF